VSTATACRTRSRRFHVCDVIFKGASEHCDQMWEVGNSILESRDVILWTIQSMSSINFLLDDTHSQMTSVNSFAKTDGGDIYRCFFAGAWAEGQVLYSSQPQIVPEIVKSAHSHIQMAASDNNTHQILKNFLGGLTQSLHSAHNYICAQCFIKSVVSPQNIDLPPQIGSIPIPGTDFSVPF